MIFLAFEPELDQLRGIRMPEPVSRAPQTWGWWVLAALVVVAVVWIVGALRSRWKADAYRRRALEELADLEALARDPVTRSDALRAVSPLLKRTALGAWPREDVAGLSSGAWLSFLDRTYPGDAFHQGAGRILNDAVYGELRVDDAAVHGLFDAARAWIRGHRA